MIELIKFLLPYILGMVCMGLMFPPMKEWQEGYEAAKRYFGDWHRGFDQGWDAAKEVFRDYDQGFGDGFEAGWNSALDKGDEE